MAHILIGWELGGNRGHAVRLAQITRELRRRGHRLSFAVQRVDVVAPEVAQGDAVWPAPITPRLIINTAKPRVTSHSMADIVLRLGLDEPPIVGAMLRSWDRMLAAIRPDAIIAEFAPFLLTAARGKVRTVSAGTGFDTPPSSMPRFPSLTGKPHGYAEDFGIECAREATRLGGAAPVEALPQLFQADREMPATYAELDPYAEWRNGPMSKPSLTDPPPEPSPGGGREVFVYTPEQLSIDAPVWKGLALSRLPVRVHAAGVGDAYRAELRRLGFAVEPQPLPLPEIGRRARLLLSHGGHGFVCSGLLMGIPQVVMHLDLEKLIHGRAVTRLGLGGYVGAFDLDPQAFARSLVQLYEDDALAARARAAAPDFHARYHRSMEESTADAVEMLL